MQETTICAGGEIGRPACRQAGALPRSMFYAYALKSLNRNYIYVGLTNNIERRFIQHQAGREKTTRAYRPFTLVLIESFTTRKLARSREKYLKSGVGKEYVKKYAQVAKLADALP